MKKTVIRYGKVITAEVSRPLFIGQFGREVDISVDKKDFREGPWYRVDEPTEDTYKRANDWADKVILLQEKYGRS